MRRILVPSDLSEYSENALKLAVDLATSTNADIYLINFTPHPVGASFTATGEINKKYPAEENLYTINLISKLQDQLANLASKYYSDHFQINYQVYDDELKDGIPSFIQENNIDLIVMGTSGEESADEFFSGNNTQQVIEVATCPVISIKNTYKKPSYERIILGLSSESDRHDNFRQAANYLNTLALALGSSIEAVHVIEPGSEDQANKREQIQAIMKKSGISASEVKLIEHEDKIEGLLQYAHQRSAAFLAVLTHAEDSFFRVFRSSLTEDLTKNSDLPVITINLHTI